MDVQRARVLSAIIVGIALLVSLFAVPASAAGCSLSAPFAVRVGDPVDIVGSGFPASTTVDVSLTLNGGTPDELTVDSSQDGGFHINLTPEAADTGTTVVQAKAGTTCTATVTMTVVAANATLPPEPTASPQAEGPGDSGTPPRTDAAARSTATTSGVAPTTWVMAILILVVGLG